MGWPRKSDTAPVRPAAAAQASRNQEPGCTAATSGLQLERWHGRFPPLLEEALSHYLVPKRISVQAIASMLNALNEGIGVKAEVGHLNGPFRTWARRMVYEGHLVATRKPGVFRNRIEAPTARLLMNVCDSLHKVGLAVSPMYALQARPRLMSGVTQACVDGFVAENWGAVPVLRVPKEVEDFRPDVTASNDPVVAAGQPVAEGVMTWVGRSLEEGANDTNARMAPPRRRSM